MMYEGVFFMRRANFTKMYIHIKTNRLHDVATHTNGR